MQFWKALFLEKTTLDHTSVTDWQGCGFILQRTKEKPTIKPSNMSEINTTEQAAHEWKQMFGVEAVGESSQAMLDRLTEE